MEGAIGGVGSGSLRPADVIDRVRVDAHLLDILARFQIAFLIHHIIQEELDQPLGRVDLHVYRSRDGRPEQNPLLALFQEERAALAHLEAHLLFFAPLGYCVVTVGDTQPCPRFPLLPSLPPRAAVFCWKPAPPPRSLPPRT